MGFWVIQIIETFGLFNDSSELLSKPLWLYLGVGVDLIYETGIPETSVPAVSISERVNTL